MGGQDWRAASGDITRIGPCLYSSQHAQVRQSLVASAGAHEEPAGRAGVCDFHVAQSEELDLWNTALRPVPVEQIRRQAVEQRRQDVVGIQPRRLHRSWQASAGSSRSCPRPPGPAAAGRKRCRRGSAARKTPCTGPSRPGRQGVETGKVVDAGFQALECLHGPEEVASHYAPASAGWPPRRSPAHAQTLSRSPAAGPGDARRNALDVVEVIRLVSPDLFGTEAAPVGAGRRGLFFRVVATTRSQPGSRSARESDRSVTIEDPSRVASLLIQDVNQDVSYAASQGRHPVQRVEDPFREMRHGRVGLLHRASPCLPPRQPAGHRSWPAYASSLGCDHPRKAADKPTRSERSPAMSALSSNSDKRAPARRGSYARADPRWPTCRCRGRR